MAWWPPKSGKYISSRDLAALFNNRCPYCVTQYGNTIAATAATAAAAAAAALLSSSGVATVAAVQQQQDEQQQRHNTVVVLEKQAHCKPKGCHI
jgi:predicted DCC family thiol-disulfide oxidoreductase YuxK